MWCAYTLAIMDNGVKKYFADEQGWVKDKDQAIWFDTFQGLSNVVFDEGLEMDEVIIDKEYY